MKYQASLKTQQRILALFAENKEYAQYDMNKAVNKDYHTVLRHLRRMEKAALIKLSRTEASTKGGKEKNIWKLTTKGLQALLFRNRDNSDALEKLIQLYPDMLLAFKKWPLFVEAGLKEKMLVVLREALYATYLFAVQAVSIGLQVKFAGDETIRQTLNSSILYTPLFGVDSPFHEQATIEKLITTYKKDEELRRFINDCFKRDLEQHQRTLEVKKLWDTFRSTDNL